LLISSHWLEIKENIVSIRGRIFPVLLVFAFGGCCSLFSGCALFVGSGTLKVPTVTITASPTTVATGYTSILTITANDAVQLTITGSDGTSYNLGTVGGVQAVRPKVTTTYTATATNAKGTTSATATVTVSTTQTTLNLTATPLTITAGTSSVLNATATNATQVTLTGSDGSSYNLQPAGGTQTVSPSSTTTYTATATGAGGNVTATITVTVVPAASLQSVKHVIFMLQENHTFDNYFGMLNTYRKSKAMNVGDDGVDYEVDGIDDKLGGISNTNDEGTPFQLFKFTSTCIDDETSDWLASFGDVNQNDFSLGRQMLMNGFVHNAEGYAKSCAANGAICSGDFTDLAGQRAMGYYDQDFLNYYYYMASQFAISDRWFSPMASKSIDNRIATFSGGTTQGLVKDPGGDDKLPQLDLPTIFQELQQANVSWKIYYSVTQGLCLAGNDTCNGSANSQFPATNFTTFAYSTQFLYENPTGAACTPPTQASSAVGDSSNSFCIDTNHIAPLSAYFTDLTNGTLPSFAFIEAGYGNNDEHPGSGQPILEGQAQVANIINSLMSSSSWGSSVFFLSYDEGGGPYDHVPPVQGHSNDFTDTTLGSIPDIAQISVGPDPYFPCLAPGGVATTHCDLSTLDPGANPGDAPAIQGFGAQLGFRVPDIVISPFSRKHYVSHTPMDHTAVIKFVENLFIASSAHLTARDAVQPNLLDFFDFTNVPWSSPPSPPTPVSNSGSCTPTNFGPAPPPTPPTTGQSRSGQLRPGASLSGESLPQPDSASRRTRP
jgi:phospholipase C